MPPSLRRVVTSTRFLPEVDGFRFVAILIVVLSHLFFQCHPMPGRGGFYAGLAQVFHEGQRGVFLFFTISGFILVLPFARYHLQQGQKVNVAHFLRRRATRLVPPYALVMLLRACMLVLARHRPFGFIARHLLATLFYLHGPIFGTYSTIDPPAWSLEVEIQFCVLTPLLTGIFLIRRKAVRRGALLALILASGAAANFLIDPDGRVALTLPYYLHYFFAGFLLCDLYLIGDFFRLPRWLWDLLGLAALAWILGTQAEWYPMALPFATLMLFLAGFRGMVLPAFFSMRLISLIGGMCYSIYLTHTTVLTLLTPLVDILDRMILPDPLEFALILGSCLATVLGTGTVYFLLVERPCMDPGWPARLRVRLRGA